MTFHCGKCGDVHERNGQRYCLSCHAAFMRRWRKTHPDTPEQRKRGIARAYARVYTMRGKLKRKPCKRCGDAKSERHHPNYDRPLHVIWLCRPCHTRLHHMKQIRTVPKDARQGEKP